MFLQLKMRNQSKFFGQQFAILNSNKTIKTLLEKQQD